jgi:hypothetical protein
MVRVNGEIKGNPGLDFRGLWTSKGSYAGKQRQFSLFRGSETMPPLAHIRLLPRWNSAERAPWTMDAIPDI